MIEKREKDNEEHFARDLQRNVLDISSYGVDLVAKFIDL